MISADTLYSVYAISIAATHILFVIVLLRLWQLARATKLCPDSLTMRIGVILAVVGTLTLASIPITATQLLSKEAMLWSLVRTVGLLVISWVVFHAILRLKPWDGHTERRKRQRAEVAHDQAQ